MTLSATWIAEPSRFYQLGQALCRQLPGSAAVPTATATQVLKNLLYLGLVFYRHPALPATVPPTEEAEPAAVEGKRKERTREKPADGAPATASRFPALHWLFRRLSFIARRAAKEAADTVMAVTPRQLTVD